MNMFKRFLRNRRGATAIEYALIASLISMVIVGGASVIGGDLNAIFVAVSAGF